MANRQAVYRDVLQSVLKSEGRPFNLRGLAQATKLTQNQTYGALARLLEAGLVKKTNEQRTNDSGRGRGERIYQRVSGPQGADSLLGKTHAVVTTLASVREFTTVDVVRRLGCRSSGWPLYSASAVKLVLDVLEMQGVLARVVECTISRGRGRPGQRWTSNPENLEVQKHLTRLAEQYSE